MDKDDSSLQLAREAAGKHEGEGTLTLGGGVKVPDHHLFSDKSFPAFSLFIDKKVWKPITGTNTVGL